jgi:hypothetical protein
MLSRRRGVQGHVFDSFDEWRTWPVHAVTGLTADGGVISSARIQRPQIESQLNNDTADVRVGGAMPKYLAAKRAEVATNVQYTRRFQLDPSGLRVTTVVTTSAEERPTELYETIPIFLRETPNQPPATIRFQVDSEWSDATTAPQTVRAVQVSRYTGAVVIAFAQPVSVRLSPDVWTDGFQTQAQCRTVLVDLLPELSLAYTIAADHPE